MKFEIAFFTFPLLCIFLYNVDKFITGSFYVSTCNFESQSIVPFYECRQECSNCVDTSMNKCSDLINHIEKIVPDRNSKNITELCNGGYKCCDQSHSGHCFRHSNNNKCVLTCNIKYNATLYYRDINKRQFNQTETLDSVKEVLGFTRQMPRGPTNDINFMCYIINDQIVRNADILLVMFIYTSLMGFVLAH